MSTTYKSEVLVLGASGKAGALVAGKLEAQGHLVRRASRSSAVPFDWDDRATWRRAITGTDAVFFLPTETLSLEDRAAFVAVAEDEGVKRIVQLSVRGLSGEGEYHATEQAVVESGLQWTLLRPCWFAQDFSAPEYFLEGVRAGVVATPAGDGREPFIHAEDIAEVAVAALTSPDHHGKAYDLSGPDLLSFAEALEIISEAVGREIKHVKATIAESAAALERSGHPSEAAVAVAQFLHEISNGADAFLSNGVEEALGKKPRSFAEYARDAAATGVWS
ncbi:NAD(P)H-binding protein [Cellulosimicrobium funkei]|uniref:NAD(P)H-binding protein n=1 Tax=Cellulosimicrobium funkei TaxID=264251 RepID=UPI0036919E35